MMDSPAVGFVPVVGLERSDGTRAKCPCYERNRRAETEFSEPGIPTRFIDDAESIPRRRREAKGDGTDRRGWKDQRNAEAWQRSDPHDRAVVGFK